MGKAEGDLLEIADGLYALDLGEFTAARDAASKAADDKGLAKAVKALRKPSLAAWAVNLLVRREQEQIDQVLALGESLRAAAGSLDGAELRELTRQRRQLTAVLANTAREVARDEGVRLTEAVVDQVAGVLNAAMLDPAAADVVRSGLVLTAFTSTGVSDLDVDSVCAVPAAVPADHRATATEAEVPAPPQLHVVPDDHLRVEQARERLAEAARRVGEAVREQEEVETAREELRARRLQLREEIDELQRRISGLEDEVDGVDEDLEEVEEGLRDAGLVLEEARREQAAAERELARLDD